MFQLEDRLMKPVPFAGCAAAMKNRPPLTVAAVD
jgi:hypothetical protein